LFVISQWIIDIILPLPLLLSGDLNTVSSGSICSLSIFSHWLILYICSIVYFISLAIIAFLYRQVITHVSNSSAAAAGQLILNREVTVIRRIVQIVAALIFCGFPYVVFFVISWFNPTIIPDYYLHIVYISIISSIFIQMIILIVYTSAVRKVLLQLITKCHTNQMRIQPMNNTQMKTIGNYRS
jgi:hypothetical protein